MAPQQGPPLIPGMLTEAKQPLPPVLSFPSGAGAVPLLTLLSALHNQMQFCAFTGSPLASTTPLE